MADLSRLQADLPTMIVGSTSTGSPTTPIAADTNGNMLVKDFADGTLAGTLPTVAGLAGGSVTTAAPAYSTSTINALSLTTAGLLRVDGSGVTQPVSGVITQTFSDVIPATQSITTLDVSTATLIGANGQAFFFGTPTAGSAATFSLSSINTVTIQATLLGAGGTMVIEVSMDGTTWIRPSVYQPFTQAYSNGFTAPFLAVVNTAGMSQIRVRGTVSWSGTATILVHESLNQTPDRAPLNGAQGVGTIAALNAAVAIAGGSAITWSLSGTWVGTVQTQAQGGDGQWWSVASLSNQSGLITNGTSINGVLEMNGAGWTQVRLVATAWTSGTATVTWNVTEGEHVIIPYSSNGANFNTYTVLTDTTQTPLGTTAASTAATAAQTAQVVALSPNSPIPTGTNNIGSITNITGTISLATGAATSANQTTEITSLQLIDNPIGSAAGGTAGTASYDVGGIFNTTQPTLTSGQQASLQLSATAELLTADIINVSSQYRAQSVTTTAAQALGGGAVLANRKFIQITPTNGTIFYGTSNAVTTTTGSPLFSNQTLTMSFGANVQLWVIAAGTVDTRVLEGS